MPATRIVIDMQPAFSAAMRPNVIIGVAREIMEAMRQKAPIIIVEFKGSGDTHKGYLDMLKGYPRFARITKNSDTGGKEVLAALQRRQFPRRHLRVCGVNTDACVMATVRDLVKSTLLAKSKIELVKSACGSGRPDYDWRTFPVQAANLALV